MQPCLALQLELELDVGSNMELHWRDTITSATLDTSDTCVVCTGMVLQAKQVRIPLVFVLHTEARHRFQPIPQLFWSSK